MSKSVLVIDDSPSIRRMVAMTLGAAGYCVTEADDGHSGLKCANDGRFDMLITDQNMPGMSGLDFIRAFRSNPSNRGVPILFLSTDTDGSLKNAARDAGALGWLAKPFEPPRLLAVTSKVLGG